MDVIDKVPDGPDTFYKLFLISDVGLELTGLSELKPGAGHTVGPNDRVTFKIITDGNGKKTIRACADPDVFKENYDYEITSYMKGRQLLEMLSKIEGLDGVLVCSAKKLVSVPIYKPDALKLLAGNFQTTSESKPWWKFW